MLNLDIRTSDPLRILATTRTVLKGAKFVSLNPGQLSAVADAVRTRYEKGLGNATQAVGATGDLTTDIQRVFIQDAVNFSFWPRPGSMKWWVATPDSGAATGWYAIVTCVGRAIAENVPILDANFLTNISVAHLRDIFRGQGGTELPMLHERAAALREAGNMLRTKFGGSFTNALAETDYDAIRLAELVTERFPSFRDAATFDGSTVVFLKRAQIVPNDLNYVLRDTATPLQNVSALTAFADYKLPQVLRHFGLIRYADNLASRVDQLREIQSGSREEIEIRAATVWSVELLRQRINKLTAADIDNALWLLGRDLAHELRPHHRTRTIWY